MAGPVQESNRHTTIRFVRSFFFPKDLVIGASVFAALVGPDWRSRSLGVSEVFPSQRLLCFVSDRKHGGSTTPHPTPTPITTSPPVVQMMTATISCDMAETKAAARAAHLKGQRVLARVCKGLESQRICIHLHHCLLPFIGHSQTGTQ